MRYKILDVRCEEKRIKFSINPNVNLRQYINHTFCGKRISKCMQPFSSGALQGFWENSFN